MDINAGTLDIAFVAFADRFEALHEYAQKDSCVCAHHNYDCTYTATETANSYSVYCNRCKTDLGVVKGISSDGYKVITPEIFNVTQAYGAGEATADTSKNHFEYSVKTEGMLSYVHIDFTQATNKESYMYLQKGLTNTGRYVAVIYRSNNTNAGEVFITGGGYGTGNGNCTTTWNSNAGVGISITVLPQTPGSISHPLRSSTLRQKQRFTIQPSFTIPETLLSTPG